MKYFIIAGEASGDLHGANLIKSIKQKDSKAEFNFWGGDLMANEATGLLQHFKEVAIMGFIEVLFRLPFILKSIKRCKQQITSFKPDVVVLIDYPGFNLRMAKFCKQNNLKVVYYIAPKVWAWKENRAKILEKYVDELLLVFPFEFDYFKKWKIKSTYVGNPLLDEISNFKTKNNSFSNSSNRSIIALLPGSRKQEIEKTLPLMIQLADNYLQYQFVVCAAPSIDEIFYQKHVNQNCKIVFNQTYSVLNSAQAAIVCSGTATLEAALFNVPQVCAYKANPFSIAIAKLFVKTKYISLVNLILNKTAIVELIQENFNLKNLQLEFENILPGGKKYDQILLEYKNLQTILGYVGASDKSAEIIFKLSRKS